MDELGGVLGRAFPGEQVVATEPLFGGVSCRAVAVTLASSGGGTRRVVVRRPSRGTPAETRAVVQSEHALLLRCSALGIAAPRPCFVELDSATIVLEYVEGAPDFAPRDPSRMLELLAAELSRIHAVPLGADLAFLVRRQHTAESIMRRTNPPDTTLDEPGLRALLQPLWPFEQHNADVLLHGDYWPGNVVWKDGSLAAVLDWEESEVGDPLSDVAIARLDIAWAFGDDAMHEFTARYRERTAIDWQNLARWDLLTALRPMGSLARWASAYVNPPISRPDIDEPHMRAVHRRFVERARRELQ